MKCPVFKCHSKSRHCLPREGVIIEWPLNGHFNDARDVVLTSRTEVRELDDDDDDPDRMLFSQKLEDASLD